MGIVAGADVLADSANLISQVMRLSLVFVVIYALQLVISIISTKALYDEYGLDFGKDFSSLFLYSMVGFGLILLVPACSYFGAKQQNPALLQTAACCNCLCGICSLLGLISTAAALAGEAMLEDFGSVYVSGGAGVVIALIDAVLVFLFLFSAYKTHKLSSAVNVVVVVQPAVEPGAMQVHVQHN
mmetsp:Transcript_6601/g.16826  ORF Transcript_6601/g.16826 Transcript_6601/m.16826 type:complete len:185 (+) Transcript_6601:115-669(+)